MLRHGFKMQLHPGKKAEYKKRHAEIWPELVALLHQAGISNYSIFLDDETNTLFGYLERGDDHTMNDLPNEPVMKKWWAYMRDLMAYNDDGTPYATGLSEVFYMK
jgi:L-rhamnose mutarotase